MHLLEKHNLTKEIFEQTRRYLTAKGLILREGTIVDATIINAPSSTKNRDKARDPEMKQTKEREPVVCWHEGAYRDRYGQRIGATDRVHGRRHS